MASLGDLAIELGIVGDTSKLEEFVKKANEAGKATQKHGKEQENTNKTLQKSVAKLRNFVLAITGAIYALNRMTDSLVAQNQAFLNFTRQTDISLRTFQKWGSVGAIVDKSLGEQGVMGTLESLNEKLFEMRLTGEGARGFILAGINPMGGAENVLEQLRNRIQGMNNTQASWLLKQMGIDPKMITLLRMSKEEFDQLSNAMRRYQLTAEQRESIDKMNRQLQMSRMQLQYFKDRAVLAVMPAFTKFMQALARITELLVKVTKNIGKFAKEHRILIASIVAGLSKIKPFVMFLKNLLKTCEGLIVKIPILGRLFVGLSGFIARALLPLTALFLLLEDIAVYSQGGKSLIGEGIDFLSNLWNSDDSLFDKVSNLLEGILGTLTKLADRILGLDNNTLTNTLDFWMKGIKGEIRTQEDFDRAFGKVWNTTNNNQQTNISMNNNFNTSQPANEISGQLASLMTYGAYA